MTRPTAGTAADLVQTIYRAAREVSHESRRELASEIEHFNHGRAPLERWRNIVGERCRRGVVRDVKRAGQQIVRAAGGGHEGRLVRFAVQNLVRAVADLTEYVPEYEEAEFFVAEGSNESLVFPAGETMPMYLAPAESGEELDELRQVVYDRLVELDELLKDHPDPFARLAAVAGRIAEKLLPTREAARVGAWFGKVAAA